MRKQVDRKLGAAPTGRRKKSAPTAGVDAHCHACGHDVKSEADMTRHRDATGHGRFEILRVDGDQPDQPLPLPELAGLVEPVEPVAPAQPAVEHPD
jgi:hypothetical protein